MTVYGVSLNQVKMMSEEELLSKYKMIESISDEMLIAAKAKNIEKFEELEFSCKTLVNSLPKAEDRCALSKAGVKVKIETVMRILENDKKIRNILEPWMVRLAALISPSNNKLIKPMAIH